MRIKRFLTSGWAKAALFLLCVTPIAVTCYKGFHDGLGGNPIEYITHFTGDWTLRFLVFTLMVTPLRRILRWPELIRFRRILGLFAFSYGCLHFFTYLWLDRFFDWTAIVKDVGKRPFITVGFTGFVLLVPLAITSTQGWIRRLGGKRWQFLHRAAYLSLIAGVIHYYWLVKSDVRKPVMYAEIAALLLGYRLVTYLLGVFRARRAPRALQCRHTEGTAV